MLAIIPFLCPFDDIALVIIVLLCPAFGLWLKKKFKWCKKSCDCACHDQLKKKFQKLPEVVALHEKASSNGMAVPLCKCQKCVDFQRNLAKL